MAGFAFELDDTNPPLFPGDRTKLATTSSDMRFITKHDLTHIPNVLLFEIADRVKATPLTTLLCCY